MGTPPCEGTAERRVTESASAPHPFAGSHESRDEDLALAGLALTDGSPRVILDARTGEDRGLCDGASTYVINEFAAVGIDMNVYPATG